MKCWYASILVAVVLLNQISLPSAGETLYNGSVLTSQVPATDTWEPADQDSQGQRTPLDPMER